MFSRQLTARLTCIPPRAVRLQSESTRLLRYRRINCIWNTQRFNSNSEYYYYFPSSSSPLPNPTHTSGDTSTTTLPYKVLDDGEICWETRKVDEGRILYIPDIELVKKEELGTSRQWEEVEADAPPMEEVESIMKQKELGTTGQEGENRGEAIVREENVAGQRELETIGQEDEDGAKLLELGTIRREEEGEKVPEGTTEKRVMNEELEAIRQEDEDRLKLLGESVEDLEELEAIRQEDEDRVKLLGNRVEDLEELEAMRQEDEVRVKLLGERVEDLEDLEAMREEDEDRVKLLGERVEDLEELGTMGREEEGNVLEGATDRLVRNEELVTMMQEEGEERKIVRSEIEGLANQDALETMEHKEEIAALNSLVQREEFEAAGEEEAEQSRTGEIESMVKQDLEVREEQTEEQTEEQPEREFVKQGEFPKEEDGDCMQGGERNVILAENTEKESHLQIKDVPITEVVAFATGINSIETEKPNTGITESLHSESQLPIKDAPTEENVELAQDLKQKETLKENTKTLDDIKDEPELHIKYVLMSGDKAPPLGRNPQKPEDNAVMAENLQDRQEPQMKITALREDMVPVPDSDLRKTEIENVVIAENPQDSLGPRIIDVSLKEDSAPDPGIRNTENPNATMAENLQDRQELRMKFAVLREDVVPVPDQHPRETEREKFVVAENSQDSLGIPIIDASLKEDPAPAPDPNPRELQNEIEPECKLEPATHVSKASQLEELMPNPASQSTPPPPTNNSPSFSSSSSDSNSSSASNPAFTPSARPAHIILLLTVTAVGSLILFSNEPIYTLFQPRTTFLSPLTFTAYELTSRKIETRPSKAGQGSTIAIFTLKPLPREGWLSAGYDKLRKLTFNLLPDINSEERMRKTIKDWQYFWKNGLWSVEFKQPFLQISRNYTPLPPIEELGEWLLPVPALSGNRKRSKDDHKPLIENELRFLIKLEPEGEVSRWLFDLPIGSKIYLRGPHWEYIYPTSDTEVPQGLYNPPKHQNQLPQENQEQLNTTPTYIHSLPKTILFLSGGTGIAPALQLASSLFYPNLAPNSKNTWNQEFNTNTNMNILYATRTATDIPPTIKNHLEILKALAAHKTGRYNDISSTYPLFGLEGEEQEGEGSINNRPYGGGTGDGTTGWLQNAGIYASPPDTSRRTGNAASSGGNLQVTYFVDSLGTFISPEIISSSLKIHSSPILSSVLFKMPSWFPSSPPTPPFPFLASTRYPPNFSTVSASSSLAPGAENKFFFISGPSGFVRYFAGYKPADTLSSIYGNEQAQGRVSGVIADVIRREESRRSVVDSIEGECVNNAAASNGNEDKRRTRDIRWGSWVVWKL